MTIAEAREKCKNLVSKVPRDILVLATIILSSLLSFGLGYLTGLDKGKGNDLGITRSTTIGEVGNLTETSGVVASKSGTKYYLPSCAGADRISEANKIWFASAEAAKSAGYSPALNCKGL